MTDPRTTPVPDRVRSDVGHDARVRNHWLGGTAAHPADRAAGGRIAAPYPGTGEVAGAERALPGRAMGCPAGETGIGQFLDIGTGLPGADHTPEAARRSTAPVRRSAFAGFLAGPGLVEPGPVSCAHWRSEPGAARVARFGQDGWPLGLQHGRRGHP
ncbi:hypothetical protein GCM10010433_76880 [Streptomyces pulveraceus]|uniref:SAM-dependent methyltransferase n=1 Tax=Streptomyces pulveraceus TaxID=68258 RepID=A0ABW1GGW9_9ACTN